MASSYIPSTDSGFSGWLQNFSDLITANPITYGLISGDAVLIAAQNTAYQAAYATATNPSTRTPAAVAAKDAAKSAALAVVRPYAVQISLNPGVTDEDKVAVGVTVRKIVPSPIPAPTAVPQASLVSLQPLLATVKVVNSETPFSKAKPFGSIGVQLFLAVGTTAAVDPEQLSFYGQATKIPVTIGFDSGQQGKICSLAARYATRGGIGGVAKVGPWSAIITFTVA